MAHASGPVVWERQTLCRGHPLRNSTLSNAVSVSLLHSASKLTRPDPHPSYIDKDIAHKISSTENLAELNSLLCLHEASLLPNHVAQVVSKLSAFRTPPDAPQDQAVDVLERCVSLFHSGMQAAAARDISEYLSALVCLKKAGEIALRPATDRAVGRMAAGLLNGSRWKMAEADGKSLVGIATAMANAQQQNVQLWDAIAMDMLRHVRTLSTVDCAHAAWAFARSGHYRPGLLSELSEQIKGREQQLDCQDVSNVLWAFARFQHYDAQLFGTLVNCAVSSLHAWRPHLIPTLVWACAKVHHYDSTAIRTCCQLASRRLNCYDAQSLSMMAWALATLKHVDQEFFTLLADHLPAKVGQMTAQALCNITWAYAHLELQSSPLLVALVAESLTKMNTFSPKELSMLLWSLATLKHCPSPIFLVAAAKRTALTIRLFNPLDASNISWAFAVLGHHRASLFNILAGHAVVRITKFNMQMLSQLLWAMATAKAQGSQQLFSATAMQLRVHLHSCTPGQLSMALWAFAALGHSPGPFLDAALPLLRTHAFGLSTYDLANAAWAVAKFDRQDADVWSTLARASKLKANDFLPSSLPRLAWAFARCRYYDRDLFDGIAEAVCRFDESTFSADEMGILCWSFGAANHHHKRLKKRCWKWALDHMRELSAQNLCNVAWGLALMPGGGSRHLFKELFVYAAQIPASEYQTASLLLLLQAQALLHERGWPVHMPRPCFKLALKAWWDQRSFTGIPPGLGDVYHQIAQTLQQQLELEVSWNQPDASGRIVGPFVVAWKGQRVSLVIHGPGRFSSVAPFNPTGSCAAHGAVLFCCGAVPALLPHWEWQKAAGSGAKHKYLREALDVAVATGEEYRSKGKLWSPLPDHAASRVRTRHQPTPLNAQLTILQPPTERENFERVLVRV